MRLPATVMLATALSLPAVASDWRPIYGTPAVIDGDTIAIEGQRIRLWGIDAEERTTEDGQKAKYNLQLLTEGQGLICLDTGGRTYGRVVAVCCMHGEDLGSLMVHLGYARDWDEAHPDGPKHSGGFYAGTVPGDACQGYPPGLEALLDERD